MSKVQNARRPPRTVRPPRNGAQVTLEQIDDEVHPDETIEQYIARVNDQLDEVEGDPNPRRSNWDVLERQDIWMGEN